MATGRGYIRARIDEEEWAVDSKHTVGLRRSTPEDKEIVVVFDPTENRVSHAAELGELNPGKIGHPFDVGGVILLVDGQKFIIDALFTPEIFGDANAGDGFLDAHVDFSHCLLALPCDPARNVLKTFADHKSHGR